jgi:type II secretory pathway component PulF
MSLLTTPGQLTSRSELFHQLGQVTASGIGLIDALEILHRNPPRPSLRTPIARLTAQLQAGNTFGDSLERAGGWLSTFDVALLQAGEKSGRLPDCFRLLSNYYAERARLARQVIAFSVYPLIVFHVAVFLFPISRFTDLILKGAIVPFVAQKAAVLAPIYGLVLFACFAMQSTRAEGWRRAVERVLGGVPILGKARRSLAVARLSVALEALLNAGVNMIEAWTIASVASGSPALRRIVAEETPRMLSGSPPSDIVSAHREFPPAFVSLYHTGEVSGTLDDALRRGYALFQEEGSRGLKQFVFGLAGVFVAGVMLLVAFNIIRFYVGYFQQIGDAINMGQ